jgi:hypothetical protein
MKITRLRITNYRGVARLDIELPPAGAVIKGANAIGKTSILRAIASAITAEGCGPDAVRLGSDASEILVNMDEVRRSITARSHNVVVKPENGERWTRPQQRLKELIGGSLDPLALFLAAPKDRRRLILEAVPLRVTSDDVVRWCGLSQPIAIPDKHGLEIISILRKDYYEKRAEANREAKAAHAAADAIPRPVVPRGVAPLEDAVADEEKASRQLATLRMANDVAARASAASAETRLKIADLRRRAARPIPIEDPAAETMQTAEEDLTVQREFVENLRRQLTVAVAKEETLVQRLADLKSRKAEHDRFVHDRNADALRASELEASLASVTPPGATAEEITQAETALAEATRARVESSAAEAAQKQLEAGRLADIKAREADQRAAKLDAIVQTLTMRAPAELAEREEMIPGLAFDDETITLDGVPIDSLSGAEQMRFAVDLARRLSKAKILLVDGLERLDSEGLDAFVKTATADDWQLIATRVADGDLVVEAIEP